MGNRTTTIRFGGTDYTVHAFNIGELERVTDLISGNTAAGRLGFSILRIAMERAEPKVDDVNAIEPDGMDEITTAASKILELAGLKVTTANPPQAPPDGA